MLSSLDKSASRRSSLARTCRMSRSYARTATYSAAASRNTLTTVRSLAGAPAEGSRCRNSVIESAPAQAGPPKRPSTEIGPVAVTTWRLCCAAVWTGTNNASVSKACSLSVPRIDCRPESAQHVGERAVGPEVDVIQVGGVTDHVAVHSGRRDPVRGKRVHHTSNAGVSHREVARGDGARGAHHLHINGRPVGESGGHRAAAHGDRPRDQNKTHLSDAAARSAVTSQRFENGGGVDRQGDRWRGCDRSRRSGSGQGPIQPGRQVERIPLAKDVDVNDLRLFPN